MSNSPAPCTANSNRRGGAALFIAQHGIVPEIPFGALLLVDPVQTGQHAQALTWGHVVSAACPNFLACPPNLPRQPIELLSPLC